METILDGSGEKMMKNKIQETSACARVFSEARPTHGPSTLSARYKSLLLTQFGPPPLTLALLIPISRSIYSNLAFAFAARTCTNSQSIAALSGTSGFGNVYDATIALATRG